MFTNKTLSKVSKMNRHMRKSLFITDIENGNSK